MRVSALPRGLAIGLGGLALACGGSTTSAGGPPEPTPKHIGTTDSGTPNAGGAAATTTGGTASGGGAPAITPQLPGGTLTDGTAGRHWAPGGAAGSGGAGGTPGGGGVPDQGTAGDPNLPDPLIPDCTAVISEDWTHAIGAGSNWEVLFGDPLIDVANHRLVVTYDDVAARTTAYQGGYYISAEVTLEGGTVLTPYPYSNEMRWPSLRRSSTGSNVELGGAKYGGSELWTTNDWPGFSGTIIAGTTTVTLTTYVKATAKALAVKVTFGAHAYRSGWVSGFTWPQTNLGIMRYIGENNSRVSTGDAVYVGPLSGCQKLSDAAVQASFEN